MQRLPWIKRHKPTPIEQFRPFKNRPLVCFDDKTGVGKMAKLNAFKDRP
jgi:hypothetical protein